MQLNPDVNPETLTWTERLACGLVTPGAFNKAIMDYKIRQASKVESSKIEKNQKDGSKLITDTMEFVKKQGGGGTDAVAMRYVANLAAKAVKDVLGEVGLDLQPETYEDIRHLVMQSIDLGDAANAQQSAVWAQQMKVLQQNVEGHMNKLLAPEANPMFAMMNQFMQMFAMMNNQPTVAPQQAAPMFTPNNTSVAPAAQTFTAAPSAPAPVSLASLVAEVNAEKPVEPVA